MPALPEPRAGGFHPASAGTHSPQPGSGSPDLPSRLRGAAENPLWGWGSSRPAPRPRRRLLPAGDASSRVRLSPGPAAAGAPPPRGGPSLSAPTIGTHCHVLGRKVPPPPPLPFAFHPVTAPSPPTVGFARAESLSQSYLQARSVPLCA